MKKIYFSLIFLFLILTNEKLLAQITGDTAVCAGNFYTYSANILGADSFHWITPTGWYNLQGQGTSQITVNCNQSADSIFVEGFDSLGASLGVQYFVTHFGGGGPGWKAHTPLQIVCNQQPLGNQNILVYIEPDTSGGGGGCGSCSGGANPNIIYGVYNNVWPFGNYLGNADSSSFQISFSPGTYTFYVYGVDTSLGKTSPQAVLISGGACGGAVSNSITITIPAFFILASPSPGNSYCLGSNSHWDLYPDIIGSGTWNNIGCSVSGGPSYLDLTINNINWSVSFYGISTYGCPCELNFSGYGYDCNIVGDSTLCAGTTYSFFADYPPWLTIYSWTVPTGWYGLTGQGTSTITVTANSNVGSICCFSGGYNGCLNTQFGNGNSAGWEIKPDSIHSCSTSLTFTTQVLPNGTGGGGNCPVGCGNGVQHPNIIYGVYDTVWPVGNFVGVADSIDQINFPGYATHYYVYKVDTTNGVNPPNAILISGGCNVGTINNVITLDTVFTTQPTIVFSPVSVCIDSIVTISNSNILNPIWNVAGGIILNNNGNNIDVQPTSLQCIVTLSGIDSVSGCNSGGSFSVPVNACNSISLAADSVICAGFTYSFTATIPHATTYNWTFPNGWYDVSGQNTSQLTATANSNAGLISVTGYDSTGYFIATVSAPLDFKFCRNRDVIPSLFKTCKTDSIAANVMIGSLGTGSCQKGCGNGYKHANIAYAAYDSIWPLGTFHGFVDGTSTINPVTASGKLYVYEIDFTNGTNSDSAILIEGSCGTCTFNNMISIDTLPLTTTISAVPLSACVGDTILLTEITNAQNPNWMNAVDMNILTPNSNPATAIIIGTNPAVNFLGNDSISGCDVIQHFQMNINPCFYPLANFQSSDSVFCEKQYVDFFDLTTNNPTSWQWTFNGATPSTSTLQNPDSIYYPTNGTFDVTLIACNSYTCDTLLLQNYILEYASPPTPVITGNSGVIYSTLAVSYAWYSTANPSLILSTDSFYIPAQTGDYFVIITDSNGCNSASNIFTITALQQVYESTVFSVVEISRDFFQLNFLCNSSYRKFSIRDAQGRILIQDEIKNETNFSMQFDLSNFSKGVYLLSVECNNKLYSKKLVVM